MSKSTIRVSICRWNSIDDKDIKSHRLRAQLLHSLVEAFDISVDSWGQTDDKKTHEWVEVTLALGTEGIFTAVVEAFKVWLDRDKIEEIQLTNAHGSITLRKASAEDAVKIAKALGLKLSPPRKPRRKVRE